MNKFKLKKFFYLKKVVNIEKLYKNYLQYNIYIALRSSYIKLYKYKLKKNEMNIIDLFIRKC